jgi:hypothetical protein
VISYSSPFMQNTMRQRDARSSLGTQTLMLSRAHVDSARATLSAGSEAGTGYDLNEVGVDGGPRLTFALPTHDQGRQRPRPADRSDDAE